MGYICIGGGGKTGPDPLLERAALGGPKVKMKFANCHNGKEMPVCRQFGLAAALYLCEPEQSLVERIGETLGPESASLFTSSLPAMRQDYADLFLAPVSGRYLPPYESAQREGRLRGFATQQIEKSFNQAGFDPYQMSISPIWKRQSLFDHIGFELAFFGILIRNRRHCLDDVLRSLCDQTLEQFWEDHLVRWVPGYALELEAKAGTPFYRFVGNFTASLFVTNGS